MAMNVSKKTKKCLDPEAIGNSTAKRNNPPAPKGKGGGMAVSKKAKGLDPDAFTNDYPVRSNPSAPKM